MNNLKLSRNSCIPMMMPREIKLNNIILKNLKEIKLNSLNLKTMTKRVKRGMRSK
jgi:hypothetical protein